MRTRPPWLHRLAAPLAALAFALAHVPAGAAQKPSDVAIRALGLVGAAYQLGGESPDDGLDCSGLVRHVYREVAGLTLPRTSQAMSRVGDAVVRSDLAPGDLVFFNTRRFAFSHVGIYVGGNRFIHAPRPGRPVQIAQLDERYWRNSFDGARRLVHALPRILPAAAGIDLAPFAFDRD